MQLFPERSYTYGRRFLAIALVLSLFIHGAGGTIWALYGRRIAAQVQKMLPRPTPTPEVVALSDAIRIEKRRVPRPQRRARPAAAVRAQRPQRPRRARIAVAATLPVPTLAPLETPRPTHEPRPAPTLRAVQATVHRPLPEPTARPIQQPTIEPVRGAYSPQQIAQLESQFRRTIDAAQRAVEEPPARGGAANVPPQHAPPATDRLRYQQIMAGTPEQFLSAQGDCVPLQGPMPHGALRAYFIRCVIHYSDGYFEEVSFPWTFSFTRRMDPFEHPDERIVFGMQAPPPGLVLPQTFALSRAVCSFYRARCAAVINAEQQRGDPAYGKPP